MPGWLVDQQDELAACAAYYGLSYQGAKRVPNLSAKTLSQLANTSEMAAGMDFILGHKIGMTDEALKAQLKMHMKVMVERLHGSWVNMPVLVDKYMDLCKGVIEHPDLRAHYWQKRDHGK